MRKLFTLQIMLPFVQITWDSQRHKFLLMETVIISFLRSVPGSVLNIEQGMIFFLQTSLIHSSHPCILLVRGLQTLRSVFISLVLV